MSGQKIKWFISLFFISLILFQNPKPAFSADSRNKTWDFFPYSVTLKAINEVTLPYPPVDMIIKDGIAYIVCSSGSSGTITTVNISNPNDIPPVRSYASLVDNPLTITFYGPYAYIAQSKGVIQIINFKDINNPVQSGTIDTYGTIGRMTTNNGFLYFVRKEFGFTVYDITIPDFPILKGNQIVVGTPNSIFIKNNYAYITSEGANLSIIDISNLSQLPVVGSYNFGFTFYDIFVSDNYAYIPQGNTGVQVLDVSKLPNPEWVTNIFSRKSARQVVVSGYYTWVNDDNSVQAFYNKDPKSQLFAGSFDNGSNTINRLDVIDAKYIYLCTSDSKLKVIQIYYEY
ncbi:MAG: hypothetical protein ABSF32_09155 [Ignavibacteria bacterium]|jgi:hypothetical protein